MNIQPIIQYNKHIRYILLLASCCISAVVVAAPGNLANSPLFTTNSAPPNVFFEVDDSGSMDWEILTKKYWHVCAFNSGSDTCGWLVDNGLYRDYTGSSYQYFEYLFDNGDDAYSNSCNSSRQTLELCSTSVQNSDWRVKSSSVNVMYYNPAITYVPWQNGDGSNMAQASFAAARSDPESSSTGYSETRNLDGFVYHVWNDTHGFIGTRPTSGTINKTLGANGMVDWWDEHIRYTVNSSTITVESYTYGGAGITETISSTATLNGTGSHPELGGKTIAEVQQNIANWYQYYRRRAFVAKSAIAKVITDNPDYRYGLNFINNTSFPYNSGNTSFVEVPAGNGSITHNTGLITGLYSLNWPAKGTPLRRGLERAGRYFDNVDGKTDPVIEQCQQNFSVLFTDGYWNGSNPASTIGNADSDGHSITVADVAKYYYDQDLSPLANNVVGNVFDPATHQHMVTYTVAFGVTGLLTDTDNDGWPGNAPGLAENADWGAPFNDDPEKIDDLWHAAYNSRGTFVSAETPDDVSQALSNALSNISDRVGSAASVAFNTTTLTGNSAVFLAQFNSSNNKWSGDLLSFPLDPVTGDVDANPNWTAATILDARVNPVNTRKIFTYNGTDGVPFRWAGLTAAQKADLKVNPDNTISNDAKAQARLDFLRGDRTNETGNNGTYTFRNRNKLMGDIIHSDPVFVGKPTLTWPSTYPFPVTKGTDTYNDFKKGSAKTRDPIVYVGSNDGMLHGFNTSDGSEALAYIPNSVFNSTSATSGLHYLTDTGYTHRYYVDMPITISDVYIDKGDGVDSDGDGNTRDWHTILIGGGRAGSRGLFALDITDPALFIEDATNAQNLVLWEFDQTHDADLGFTFSKPSIAMMNNGRWAAIFGNSYNSTGDGKAKLFIVFLDGGLDGVWTDGSSGSDLDYIKISTNIGSIVSSDCNNVSSDCNGLSTPQSVDMDGDKVVDRVYAGDLKGNMWAFDVSSTNTNSWDVAYKTGATPKPLFTATHHSATPPAAPVQVSTIPQPITDKPILVKHPSALGGAPDVLVFFGTGQYLIDGDISNNAVQSFYGVWDNGTDSLTPADLVEQTFLSEAFINNGNDVSNQIRVLTDNNVNYAGGAQGWFINLTKSSGERIIVDPDVRGELVFFNTWIPDSNPCSAGGSGFLMSVKQINGGRPDRAGFDFNNDNVVDGGDLVTVTKTINGEEVVITYAPSAREFNSGLPASSNFLSNKRYTPGTDGGSTIEEDTVEDLSGSETGRFSWQELRN
jgi:type IV pilus assembly protein PilY1